MSCHGPQLVRRLPQLPHTTPPRGVPCGPGRACVRVTRVPGACVYGTCMVENVHFCANACSLATHCLGTCKLSRPGNGVLAGDVPDGSSLTHPTPPHHLTQGGSLWAWAGACSLHSPNSPTPPHPGGFPVGLGGRVFAGVTTPPTPPHHPTQGSSLWAWVGASRHFSCIL